MFEPGAQLPEAGGADLDGSGGRRGRRREAERPRRGAQAEAGKDEQGRISRRAAAKKGDRAGQDAAAERDPLEPGRGARQDVRRQLGEPAGPWRIGAEHGKGQVGRSARAQQCKRGRVGVDDARRGALGDDDRRAGARQRGDGGLGQSRGDIRADVAVLAFRGVVISHDSRPCSSAFPGAFPRPRLGAAG